MDVYIGLNVKISVRILLWCHVAVCLVVQSFIRYLLLYEKIVILNKTQIYHCYQLCTN